ncbi:hypothetical protein Tco_1313418 [Tanacetum coccineum]
MAGFSKFLGNLLRNDDLEQFSFKGSKSLPIRSIFSLFQSRFFKVEAIFSAYEHLGIGKSWSNTRRATLGQDLDYVIVLNQQEVGVFGASIIAGGHVSFCHLNFLINSFWVLGCQLCHLGLQQVLDELLVDYLWLMKECRVVLNWREIPGMNLFEPIEEVRITRISLIEIAAAAGHILLDWVMSLVMLQLVVWTVLIKDDLPTRYNKLCFNRL